MPDVNRTTPRNTRFPAVPAVPTAGLPASGGRTGGDRRDPRLLADRASDLAEAGRLVLARALAERALEIDPHRPDAAHSLAHVFCEEGDRPGGAAFLRAWLDGFPSEAPEASHLVRHLAQFELWAGRPSEARAVSARRLDAREAPRVRRRDAAAVLWRLHLSGERDPPWHTACALAEPVVDDPRCPLDAAHAALFLAGRRDGGGMTRLVEALRGLAAAGDGPAGGAVLPSALGLRSFSAGRLADAARRLTPVQGRLSRRGGSIVQRAIFGGTLARARVRTRIVAAGAVPAARGAVTAPAPVPAG